MSDYIRLPIARDVRVDVHFTGTVTQEAIQKLIEILECEKDTFPSEEEWPARA